jgi:hypothetical protein
MSKTNKTIGLLVLAAISASAEPLPENGPAKHMGVASCAGSQCHGSAVPRDGSGVLQNEYVTWTQDDPHSGAYQTLTTDRSTAIANRLGFKNAYTMKACLDCHTDNVNSGLRGERFQVSDGVGCEACHGGAETWLSTHYNAPTVTHADNLQAGLYPAEKPRDRAALCLSCHLGTKDKFASHRIMAAGHPRLAFELDTFTELWRTAGRQPHYRVDADYSERKGSASHVYTWASGLLADGRRRLALIQDDRFAGSGMFPELGLYDCHACHRSMKSVQWRRLERHANADPGVPFVSDGSFVMILALARALSPLDADAVAGSLASLHVAGSQSVEAVRIAAAELDAAFVSMQKSTSAQILQRNQGTILSEILRSGAAGEFLDYASAEQAFMAVQMLSFELEDTAMQDEIDSLAQSLENDERYRPSQFAHLLRQFDHIE